MRPGRLAPRLALPAALILLTGCQALDPSIAYRQAAQQLRVTLDRVEPNLDLAFPLERSRLRLRLTLGVDNPSDIRIAARSIEGNIGLQQGDGSLAIGRIAFPQGLDLPAHGRVPVSAEVSIAYGDLKEALPTLRRVVLEHREGTWTLEGTMKVDVLGIPISIPLHSRKHVGA